jgi:hypothetical protein
MMSIASAQSPDSCECPHADANLRATVDTF